MAKRYFEGSKAKPGVLSDNLKEALNLHSDKLPLWIYRMRVLGYPPGWLQQAKVNTLAIFDGSGEDGELNESSEVAEEEYNKESLIEFPGFNCAIPPGVRDDWHYLRMPPMLPTQQLKEALKTMKVSEPVPYKKSKLDLPSTASSPSTSTSTSTPQTSKISLENVPQNSSLTSNKSETNETESELNVSDGSLEDNSKNKSFETPSKESEKANDSTNSERKLKMIAMGSPMPVSERPKRPDLEKWAVGMGELIYFENLPEYTGVYQNKMKGLLHKIREKHNQT